MTGRYASTTEVPADRSRAEIEKTLIRYGATSFAYGWEGNLVTIGFRMRERMVKFVLPMPDPDGDEFHVTSTGRERTAKAAKDSYDQEVRRRWRALLLVIRAKLEAVESQISDFESEFLAAILLPDGRTYGQFAQPQIAHVYRTAEMPSLLPGTSDRTPALGEGR